MMLSREQIAATRKAYLDNLFNLTNGIVEGADKLARLNMEATRSTLAGQLDRTQKALAVREPQEWLRLHDRLGAPTAEKVQTRNRQLFEIAASIHVDFMMRFAQAQWEAYGHRVRTLAEDVAKNRARGLRVRCSRTQFRSPPPASCTKPCRKPVGRRSRSPEAASM
ncbi:phasin family protein [Paraburkholderia terrae]|jgi:phasin family protein|uniref:phasin family protein n=1 Tax=Paraburkholderia terrae TaxID=311230 RepID=UPI001EE22DD8|nr:phasin family protein [Paraburkholderia terrae]GJH03875.1 hypothetical protein CBA19C8_24980 [Paraburkholderia terrae]